MPAPQPILAELHSPELSVIVKGAVVSIGMLAVYEVFETLKNIGAFFTSESASEDR